MSNYDSVRDMIETCYRKRDAATKRLLEQVEYYVNGLSEDELADLVPRLRDMDCDDIREWVKSVI